MLLTDSSAKNSLLIVGQLTLLGNIAGFTLTSLLRCLAARAETNLYSGVGPALLWSPACGIASRILSQTLIAQHGIRLGPEVCRSSSDGGRPSARLLSEPPRPPLI